MSKIFSRDDFDRILSTGVQTEDEDDELDQGSFTREKFDQILNGTFDNTQPDVEPTKWEPPKSTQDSTSKSNEPEGNIFSKIKNVFKSVKKKYEDVKEVETNYSEEDYQIYSPLALERLNALNQELSVYEDKYKEENSNIGKKVLNIVKGDAGILGTIGKDKGNKGGIEAIKDAKNRTWEDNERMNKENEDEKRTVAAKMEERTMITAFLNRKDVKSGFFDGLKVAVEEGRFIPFLYNQDQAKRKELTLDAIKKFESTDQKELMNVSETIKKFQGDEELSDLDKALIQRMQAEALTSRIDKGIPYGLGESIVDMARYGFEFAALSGPAKGVVSGATKVLPKAVKILPKRLAGSFIQKLTTEMTEALVQTGMNAPMLSEKTAEYALPEYEIMTSKDGEMLLKEASQGDDPTNAFKKAFLSSYAEHFSERAGGLIKSGGSSVYKRIVERMGLITENPENFIQKALIGKLISKSSNKSTTLFAKYLRATKFDGVLEEVMEEELNEPVQASIENRDYSAPIITAEGNARLVMEILGIGMYGGLLKIPDKTVDTINKWRERRSDFGPVEIPVDEEENISFDNLPSVVREEMEAIQNDNQAVIAGEEGIESVEDVNIQENTVEEGVEDMPGDVDTLLDEEASTSLLGEEGVKVEGNMKTNNKKNQSVEEQAEQVAVGVIKGYVERGDSMGDLNSLGSITDEGWAVVKRNKIIVTRVGEKEVNISLPLEKIYNKIKNDLEPVEEDKELPQVLRGTKGMTADDIMKTFPNIQLKKDVMAKDIHGNKVEIPEGEKLTPYELKGNKILLQDGETYIVTKNQFQNIKGNSVVAEGKPFAPELEGLKETVLGGKPKNTFDSIEWTKTGEDLKGTFGERRFTIKKEGQGYYVGEDNKQFGKGVANYTEAVEELNMFLASETPTTKYGTYQLPGGQNYREILIKAPLNIADKIKDMKKEISEEVGEKFATVMTKFSKGTEYTPEVRQKIRNVVQLETALDDAGDDYFFYGNEAIYKSPHWDDPNIIAHLRVNDREYQDKKVLFMEELQSDWAKDARELGFMEYYKKEDVTSLPDTELFWMFKVPDNVLQINKSEYPTEEEAFDHVLTKNNGSHIPHNKYLKKWQELTVKRALLEAVNNDAEYFAWITGDQTSARYNLATYLKKAIWNIPAEDNKNKYVALVTKEDKEISFGVSIKDGTINDVGPAYMNWKGKKLNEVLGKGLADKIMEKDKGELSGEGLKFGGEWAGNLYDKQVKTIVEDLTGGKVEEIDMGLPVEARSSEWSVVTEQGTVGEGLQPTMLKVGMEVTKKQMGIVNDYSYIIDDVFGGGEFSAIPKRSLFTQKIDDREYYEIKIGDKTYYYLADKGIKSEAFEIPDATMDQQAIKLTPEIKARIKGETPVIETSGKQFEDPKPKKTPTKKDKDRESLKAEARKYKSAEEFIKQTVGKKIDDETANLVGDPVSRNGKLFRVDGGNMDNGYKVTETPVKYVYRAVSDAELEFIEKAGFIRSKGDKNLEAENIGGLTVFKDKNPSFYLPDEGGHILKIEVKPENNFFYDKADEYVKTANKIPSSQIVEINGGFSKSQLEEIWKQANEPKKYLAPEAPMVMEARRFKTANDFANAQMKLENEYKDAHAAPSQSLETIEERMEGGGDWSLDEVRQGHHNQPDDYFDPVVGARYYSYDNPNGQESYAALKPILKGKKKKIKAYRTVPKDVTQENLKDGDWITFSKGYAVDHGESRFGEDEYKIIEQEISIKDAWWDGNDINEWGYDTGKTWQKFTDIWTEANKEVEDPKPKKKDQPKAALTSAGSSLSDIGKASMNNSVGLGIGAKVRELVSNLSPEYSPFTAQTLNMDLPSVKYIDDFLSSINKDPKLIVGVYNNINEITPKYLQLLKNLPGDPRYDIDVKKPLNMVHKIVRKRIGGDIEYTFKDLNDALRGRVIYTEESDAIESAESIKDYSTRFSFFEKPTQFGYRGYHVNVLFGKVGAEIQFHTPDSRNVEKVIRPVYELSRAGFVFNQEQEAQIREVTDGVYEKKYTVEEGHKKIASIIEASKSKPKVEVKEVEAEKQSEFDIGLSIIDQLSNELSVVLDVDLGVERWGTDEDGYKWVGVHAKYPSWLPEYLHKKDAIGKALEKLGSPKTISLRKGSNAEEVYKEIKKEAVNRYRGEVRKYGEDADTYSGSGEASVGMFATEKELLDKISNDVPPAIQMPEMVSIYRQLTDGNIVEVRHRMGNKLGFHQAGRIAIKGDLFIDEEQATKTLAHELGHLVDFLPDNTMKRGNLLGRIASLNSFLKGKLVSKEVADKVDVLVKEREGYQKERKKIKEMRVEMGTGANAYKNEDRYFYKKIREVNKKIDELQKDAIANKAITSELRALTMLWKPFDPRINETFTNYRYSGKELYADAISVLFVRPDLLKTKAPKFWTAFWQYLNNKPDVMQAVLETYDILYKGKDAIGSERNKKLMDMFNKGEEVATAKIAEIQDSKVGYLFLTKYLFLDKNAAVIDKINELKKRGTNLSPQENPIYALEGNNYLDSKIKAYLETFITPVDKRLEKAKLTWNDLGELLFLERVRDERGGVVDLVDMIEEQLPEVSQNIIETLSDVLGKPVYEQYTILQDTLPADTWNQIKEILPAGIANPQGYTTTTARDQINYLKSNYEPAKWEQLTKAKEEFRASVKEVNRRAREAGYYTEDIQNLIESNESYATFQVLDYLELYISPQVYGQKGTFKDVANPAVSTIIKNMSVLSAIERNETKKKLVGMLLREFPKEVTLAQVKQNGKRQQIIDTRSPGLGTIKLIVNGKLQGYYVDKYIANTVNVMRNDVLTAFSSILSMPNKIYRPLFTSLNLGFQSFNFVRDFTRYWKNMPDASIGEALTSLPRAFYRYAQAVPHAWGRASNKPDKLIREMDELGILGTTYNDIFNNPDKADQQIDRILIKADLKSLSPKQKQKIFIVPFAKALNVVEIFGNFIETLPKVAGYKELKGKMPDEQLVSFLRTRVGSPDFRRGGAATPITNNIFLFSNAIKEGWRADLASLKDPTTRSGLVWKTMLITIFPKLLMFLITKGWLGDELESMMKDASEYDKANYIILPLGKDKNDKTVMMRIPQDETGRFIGGLFWKTLTTISSEELELNDIFQLLDYGAGQFPSVTPIFTGVGAIVTILSGRNPYDSFRGRYVIPPDEFTAGKKGFPEFMKYTAPIFVDWFLKNQGANIIFPNTSAYKDETLTDLQKVINAPVLSNTLGRWIKVTDQGKREEEYEAIDEAEQDAKVKTLEREESMENYIKLYLKSDKSESNKNYYINQFLEEQLGNPPYKGTVKAQATNYRKSFMKELFARSGKNELASLKSLGSNAEKKAYINSVKNNMSKEEFEIFLEEALENKFISEPLREEF